MSGASILLVGLCYLCVTETAADIDMDYYLGSLRSSCLGRKGENICQIDCQGAVSICFQGQCICDTKTATPVEQTLISDTKKFVKEVSDNLIDASGDRRAGIFFAERLTSKRPRNNAAIQAARVWNVLPLSIQQALNKLMEKHFRILLIDGIKEIEVMAAEDYVAKVSKATSLRHHIAHFCPNLEEARVCIRKCMETGKPAFCGKDHVCYCGHRYSGHDTDPEIDPAEVMSNFKDLYEKYFGRNPNEPGKTIIEEIVDPNAKKGKKKKSNRGR